MKQSFYAIGMFILIMCGQAAAQTTDQSFITRRSIMNSPFVAGNAAPLTAEVSVAALERFSKDYKNARDVEWTQVPDGYRVYFLQDAVLTVVDYTRKGRLYSVIRYGEDLLAPEIKMKFEAAFDGAKIMQVAEVKMAAFGSKAYIAVLEDERSVKTVQIIDGELNLIQEMKK